MKQPKQSYQFVAILIYSRDKWKIEEPHVYEVSHPEIAYQLALIDGQKERNGQTFLGLAELAETTETIAPIASMQRGDAQALVVPKAQLAAFHDSRWQGIPHDEAELQALLTVPPLLMELEGLDDIPWADLTHAYGSAKDIPDSLRAVVSADEAYRKGGIWQLYGNIYHQGSLYPATVPALPFLLKILQNTALPNRADIAEYLSAVAESATYDVAIIEEAWQKRLERYGEIFSKPVHEKMDDEVIAILDVRAFFIKNLTIFEQLERENEALMKEHLQLIIQLVQRLKA